MKHPKFPDLVNHLDAADTIIAEIVAARPEDSTPHDYNDMHSTQLCIATAIQLTLGADSENRAGIIERFKRG